MTEQAIAERIREIASSVDSMSDYHNCGVLADKAQDLRTLADSLEPKGGVTDLLIFIRGRAKTFEERSQNAAAEAMHKAASFIQSQAEQIARLKDDALEYKGLWETHEKIANEMAHTIEVMKIRAEAAEAQIAVLRDAIEYVHSEGFNWPSDPLASLDGDKQ